MDTRDDPKLDGALSSGGDYLWDKSGEPAPEILKLERKLVVFRHRRRVPEFPEIVPARRRRFPWTWLELFPVLTASAVALLIVAGVMILVRGRKPVPVNGPGWDVSDIAGAPRIGGNALGRNGTGVFRVGQTLETDAQSRAGLRAEDVGEIDVEPSTRLRLVTMGANVERVALDRGTIHARIWALPGQFVVDTPSAVTVDLGCAYTLHVDDSGAGLVRTSMGWVGFKLDGHESFIPAGAVCVTRPNVGPGTPYFEDASAKFRAALARWDFDDHTSQQRADDLATVLSESRPRDCLTLWHLLSRVESGQREQVYDRLSAFAPPPAGATRQGILQLDQPMLDLWWNALGFDDIAVWRQWERSWGAVTPTREK
jgi:hypothetical protein